MTVRSKAQSEVAPQWVEGVLLLRTSETSMHIAADPEIACVLAGVSAPVQEWLAQLDGQRRWGNQLDEAGARGIDRDVAARLLEDLWQGELLNDALADPVEHGPPVVIFGAGLVATQLHRLLPGSSARGALPRLSSGTAWEDVAQAAEPAAVGVDLAVVTLDGAVAQSVEVGFVERLLAAGTTTLVVGASTRTARVGPLTTPRMSACLRCEDLERSDLEPEWTGIARQLALREPGPVDQVAATLAAAEAARQLRAYLAPTIGIGQLEARCAVVGAVLETGCKGDLWRRRPVIRHAACSCWWTE